MIIVRFIFMLLLGLQLNISSFAFGFDFLDNEQGKIMDLALKPDKKKVIQALLDSKAYEAQGVSIITENEWQELDIDSVLEKLDRSKTSFGTWGLKKLTHPVADAKLIKLKQDIIIKIKQDKDKRNKILSYLKEIKAAEDDLISFWDDREALQQNAKTLYYSTFGSFTKKIDGYLNRNRLALECSAVNEGVKQVVSFLAQLSMFGIAAETFNSIASKKSFDLKRSISNGLLFPIRMHLPYKNVYANGYEPNKFGELCSNGTGADQAVYLNKAWKFPKIAALLVTIFGIACTDFKQALDVRNGVKGIKFLLLTNLQLQHRMVKIARAFAALEGLSKLLEEQFFIDAELTKMISGKTKSSKMQKLMNLLKKSTFHENAKIKYSRGNVLLAHQLFHDVKAEIVPMLQVVALMDGFTSIASLLDEDKDASARFCCVACSDEKNPMIDFKEFWTPLMPTGKVVTNSISVGPDIKNKLILTGPNGTGKSTIMKAIAHAIILGQSWGIAPAKEAKIALFTGLRTSLAPRESLKDNLSKFMAEKKRVDEIRYFIANHRDGDRFFIALDEPFNGTVDSEASHRVWLFGNEIAKSHHAMMTIATHLEKPMDLETETDAFANYQLDLQETNDGRFTRTFKLIPGPARWWFTDMHKRSRFVDQLLDANK